MNTDNKLIFESFVNSRKCPQTGTNTIEEKKGKPDHRGTNPEADIDGDGKKGTSSDRYLANLHLKVMQATQMKKKAEEAEQKMKADRVTAASHKLLGDLTKTYSTSEVEDILRRCLDTHVSAKGSQENAEVPVVAPQPAAV